MLERQGHDTAIAATPRVSVVTVFYNRGSMVAETLQCLLDQSLRDIEIIIVDDGSTDDTLERIRAFDDPRIRLIAKANSGFTSSINAGVAEAKAPYIAVHGSGDYSHPTRLEQQLAVLETEPEVGVVGCRVKNAHLGRDTFSITPPDSDRTADGYRDFFSQLMKTSVFTHGEVMYRKALFDRMGGYRKEFTFSQDYDLWLRMSEICGYRVVNDILYTRYSPPGTVRSSPDKIIIQQTLSELARQSAEARRRGERDLIEQHGDHAMLHVRRSRRLGDILVGDGVNIMVQLNDRAGFKLVQRGLVHAVTPRNLFYYALMATHRTFLFDKIVRPGLIAWRKARG